jgi:chromosome partitioning protein
MNVIVFASRKGGSGKSTLAAHLAAQIKATKPCLLIDADPQGSLTLWHKLRGTNEPPIKTAVNSVSGILSTAKRDGVEWVLIDTPPNVSAVVEDAIRNATMVIIPARPGVFDVNAVQETIQTCRAARKPYAVVLNGAPARRDDAESPIVTIAREALAKFRAPVWGGQITNRADLLMARILCGGPRGDGNRPAVGRDRALDQSDPRDRVVERRDAQAGGVISSRPPEQIDARAPRVAIFINLLLPRARLDPMRAAGSQATISM